jgi:bacterial leucyl aminopeptidase
VLSSRLQAHIRFFDITETPETVTFTRAGREAAPRAFPSSLTQGSALGSLLPQFNIDNVRADLTTFSNFHNRYYRATTGVQSAQWLFDTVQSIISDSGATAEVTVRKVTHSWQQFSVVATIAGQTAKTVVVGAHQDSINLNNPSGGRAPGADDDGSGSVTILEALRVALADDRIAAGEAPNTLEFHWYAGEEAGLLGSQAIFQQYASAGRDVAAMLNQDMVGYSPRGEFGLITDNTNAALNAFTKLLIAEYADIPYVETRCGYACSDHASATRSGYPSSFLFEAEFGDDNPAIHTANDVIGSIDFDHVLQHGKVTVSFLVELAFAPNI